MKPPFSLSFSASTVWRGVRPDPFPFEAVERMPQAQTLDAVSTSVGPLTSENCEAEGSTWTPSAPTRKCDSW